MFDLDPDVGLDFNKVKSAAVRLKALLEDLGLKSFPLLLGARASMSLCRSMHRRIGRR